MQNVKSVLVGDSCVGKSCLISYFTNEVLGCFDHSVPTVSDNYTGTLMTGSKTFCLEIGDTSGSVSLIQYIIREIEQDR